MPALFSYLQGAVDAERKRGRFVLTGSQQFGLLSGITQSLAGRVGALVLLPFSFGEVERNRAVENVETLLWRGLYPAVCAEGVPPRLWYRDYLSTHAQRGALFETWAIGEFFKHAYNRAQTPRFYFWRDSSGYEVDLVAERDNTLRAVEIKAGETIAGDWLEGLARFRGLAGACDGS